MGGDVMEFSSEELEKFETEAQIYRDERIDRMARDRLALAASGDMSLGASFAHSAYTEKAIADRMAEFARSPASLWGGSIRRFSDDETFDPVTD